MKFTSKQLEKLYNDGDFVFEELIESSRWSLLYEGVFKYEGKFYGVGWSVGATEYQDSDWFGDEDQDCPEMIEKEVVVKKWVEMPSYKKIKM